MKLVLKIIMPILLAPCAFGGWHETVWTIGGENFFRGDVIEADIVYDSKELRQYDCYEAILERYYAAEVSGCEYPASWFKLNCALRWYRFERSNLSQLKSSILYINNYFLEPAENRDSQIQSNFEESRTYSIGSLMAKEALMYYANVPTNFFDYTPWRGLAEETNYGWPALRRVITNLYLTSPQVRTTNIVAKRWYGGFAGGISDTAQNGENRWTQFSAGWSALGDNKTREQEWEHWSGCEHGYWIASQDSGPSGCPTLGDVEGFTEPVAWSQSWWYYGYPCENLYLSVGGSYYREWINSSFAVVVTNSSVAANKSKNVRFYYCYYNEDAQGWDLEPNGGYWASMTARISTWCSPAGWDDLGTYYDAIMGFNNWPDGEPTDWPTQSTQIGTRYYHLSAANSVQDGSGASVYTADWGDADSGGGFTDFPADFMTTNNPLGTAFYYIGYYPYGDGASYARPTLAEVEWTFNYQ